MSAVSQPVISGEQLDLDENRLCHIRKSGTRESWCGLKSFTPRTAHSWEECGRLHTVCIVCAGLRGRGA